MPAEKIKFYSVRLDSRNRLTIPREVRENLGLDPTGDFVYLSPHPDGGFYLESHSRMVKRCYEEQHPQKV